MNTQTVPSWGQQSQFHLVSQGHSGRDLYERLESYARSRMKAQSLEHIQRTWAFSFQQSAHGYTVTYAGPSKAAFVIQGVMMNAGGWPYTDCGIAFYSAPRNTQ